MAKSKAFTKFIGPNGSENYVHQTSPAWVVTFIRWDVRDTMRAISSPNNRQELLRVRDPLVIENDCVQISITSNKSTFTPSVTAILKETDVNYETAIAPGDFMFVNMLNWEKDARRITLIAINKKGAINGVNDGFKGVFKVQSVRKTLSVDPASGIKREFIKINGFAFTEFNNFIYFNPYMNRDNQASNEDSLLFPTNLGSDYKTMVNPGMNIGCQDLIKAMICSFIGVGVSDRGAKEVLGVPITANTHFFMPQQVGTLLGIPNIEAAKDIYNCLFGIQQYGTGSTNTSLSDGFNPINLEEPNGKFYYTTDRCSGSTVLKAEYWSGNTNAWSIINQYTNSPLNELYTCFRISKENRVMPTIVFRQIPFSTELFGKKPFETEAKITKFLNLPRWKISSSLILGTDLGREEAARVNFVQCYTAVPEGVDPVGYISIQTAARNYAYDVNDVMRSGLKPYIINSAFKDFTVTADAKIVRGWALILGDALIGGHLKMNGTIECVGIVDPIAVGDNLEYNGSVYHIEDVTHTGSINFANGNKIFRTTLKLSNGVSITDPASGLAYPEMTHSNGYQDRKDNFNNGDQSLPGISESQDVWYRTNDPDPTVSDIDKRDRPFAQPGKEIKPIKDNSDDSESK